MSTPAPKLLECPFCGSGSEIRTSYDNDGSNAVWKFVQCNGCGSRTMGKWFSPGNDCPLFYEEVRDQWNRRAKTVSSNADMLEALKAVIDGEMSDHKSQAEFGGYILDDEIREKIKAAIAKAEGK